MSEQVEPGFPSEIFEDKKILLDELRCPICYQILRDPHIDNCEIAHTFCKLCLSRLTGSKCPINKENEDMKSTPNLIVKNLLNKMNVKCIYAQEGCPFSSSLEDLERHLRCECEFKLLECPNVGCFVKLKASDFSAHQAECRYFVVTCPNKKCGKVMIRSGIDSHLETSCEWHPVDCPKSCGAKIERRLIPTHEADCPEELMDCPYKAHGVNCPRIKRKDMKEHLLTQIEEHTTKSLHYVKMLETKVQNFEADLKNQTSKLLSNIYPKTNPTREVKEEVKILRETFNQKLLRFENKFQEMEVKVERIEQKPTEPPKKCTCFSF